jgi:hypothetical protein
MIISNILSGKNEEKWIFIYLGNGVCTSYAWEMVLAQPQTMLGKWCLHKLCFGNGISSHKLCLGNGISTATNYVWEMVFAQPDYAWEMVFALPQTMLGK